MSKTNQTETTAKILTSYRRMILRAYNAKPAEMTDAMYCKRHKIKLHELRAWQKLAGQQLAVELKEMRATERIVVTPQSQNTQYSSKEFYAECAKVIELTGGGRITEKLYPHKRYIPCELARYRLLQKIASLPNSDRNYRRFTRIRDEL